MGGSGGLPGPSAPLSKVEEETSEEGGPKAEPGARSGRRVAAVVHRSGACAGERRRQRRALRAVQVTPSDPPAHCPSYPTPRAGCSWGVAFPTRRDAGLSIAWRALLVVVVRRQAKSLRDI